MNLSRRAVVAARATAAMTLQLGRATGRPDQAVRFAALHLARGNASTPLTWQGLNLSARRIDWPALQEVLIENEYGALAPYLTAKRAPIVLDLGANIGTFALFAFSRSPEAVIHSYEPSDSTYAVLAANAASNPSLVWNTTRGAAWSDDGTISFTNAEASTAGRVDEDGDERVPALSLASIVAQCGGHIDIAKIDIEGAEEPLLANRSAELSAIETVVVELHPNRCDAPRVARALCESFGQVYRIPGRRSSKPLVLASRAAVTPDLPTYEVGDV
ncbi:MAG: FkbM family methyltransferase [Hyphomicrobiaceae bacterium]|nr:FkbM family methyltransferase [Hyphomicrobiaceae bacterium]